MPAQSVVSANGVVARKKLSRVEKWIFGTDNYAPGWLVAVLRCIALRVEQRSSGDQRLKLFFCSARRDPIADIALFGQAWQIDNADAARDRREVRCDLLGVRPAGLVVVGQDHDVAVGEVEGKLAPPFTCAAGIACRGQ